MSNTLSNIQLRAVGIFFFLVSDLTSLKRLLGCPRRWRRLPLMSCGLGGTEGMLARRSSALRAGAGIEIQAR